MLYCRHLTILIHFLGLGIGIAHCTLRLLIVFRVGAYTNNKDRPTKHSLSLSKLTNHSSEWKVGWFCRLKIWFSVNEFLVLVLAFKKIIEFKFVQEVCVHYEVNTNKDKSTEIFPPLLVLYIPVYEHVQCWEPKKVCKSQKVSILKKTTVLYPSRSYFSTVWGR